MAKKGQKYKGKPGEKVKRDATKILKESEHQADIKNLDKTWDSKLKAELPGRRVSQFGNVYYEYRENRSDINPEEKL